MMSDATAHVYSTLRAKRGIAEVWSAHKREFVLVCRYYRRRYPYVINCYVCI